MTRAELTEAVARAIREAAMRTMLSDCVIDSTLPLSSRDYLRATAALAVVAEAMRETTSRMDRAGGDVLTYDRVEALGSQDWHPDDAAEAIYHAMLAASPLAEDKP